MPNGSSWTSSRNTILPAQSKSSRVPTALASTGQLGCRSRPTWLTRYGGRRWADLASLIETCKLNGVNPQVYLTDLLTRLVNGWPQSRIDELMPWHWAPAKNS